MSSRATGETGRWPELFVGLSAETCRVVNNAIANNVLEGWNPSRADVEEIIAVVRGLVSTDDYLARLPCGADVRGLD